MYYLYKFLFSSVFLVAFSFFNSKQDAISKANISETIKKDVDLNGIWEGAFTQKGGYKDEYKTIIKIVQKGKKISGTTISYVDNLHATLRFEGEIKDNKFVVFAEKEFIETGNLGDEKAWCKKSIAVQIKHIKGTIVLEGLWGGKSSFGDCIPGTVVLKKMADRP